ncbi:MAG TPA: TetR/AcrR family transcriptional regulator [Solirubrobacter sp.]
MSAASSRPRNPRGEGNRLREQLLAATAEVLNEVGDASRVSVRAIAARAGVSPTALYLQFPDRDSLVDAAVDAGFDTFNTELTAAAAVPGSPDDRLMAMGLAYLAFSEHKPALYSILFSARRPLVDKHVHGHRDQAFDGVVALLQARTPTLSSDAANELAILVWTSLHGYAMLRAVRPHMPWPDPDVFLRRLLAVSAPN